MPARTQIKIYFTDPALGPGHHYAEITGMENGRITRIGDPERPTVSQAETERNQKVLQRLNSIIAGRQAMQ